MYQKKQHKLVIIPNEIRDNAHWALNLNDDTITCSDCGSHLFYIKIEWGVVAEDNNYGIMGNRQNITNRTYNLREVGFALYCAECGEFEEHYWKNLYPEDKLICTWDELAGAEKAEIEYCLNQFDQKGDFKPSWKNPEVNVLKEKLKEYEKKYPLKKETKRKKK